MIWEFYYSDGYRFIRFFKLIINTKKTIKDQTLKYIFARSVIVLACCLVTKYLYYVVYVVPYDVGK